MGVSGRSLSVKSTMLVFSGLSFLLFRVSLTRAFSEKETRLLPRSSLAISSYFLISGGAGNFNVLPRTLRAFLSAHFLLLFLRLMMDLDSDVPYFDTCGYMGLSKSSLPKPPLYFSSGFPTLALMARRGGCGVGIALNAPAGAVADFLGRRGLFTPPVPDPLFRL